LRSLVAFAVGLCFDGAKMPCSECFDCIAQFRTKGFLDEGKSLDKVPDFAQRGSALEYEFVGEGQGEYDGDGVNPLILSLKGNVSNRKQNTLYPCRTFLFFQIFCHQYFSCRLKHQLCRKNTYNWRQFVFRFTNVRIQ
jgi:hypothetical protein